MPLTISKRHFVSVILLFGVFVHAWCLHATPIDFMESKHRTSPFAPTDGEETMLPYFTGETSTCLYTVYFLGRTAKERSFWDVYNKVGFWKDKDNERPHLYAKDIERHITTAIKQYNIFAIAIDKGMIKDIQKGDFTPNDDALYATFLLKEGKWTVVDSFNVMQSPTNTAEYLMKVLDKTNRNNAQLLGDSLVSSPNFAHNVNATCAENASGCILEKLKCNYYQLHSNTPTMACRLDESHKMKFKSYKTRTDTEEHIKTYALLLTNNVVSDSILCYEYYNNAGTLSCYEQLYYVDISKGRIWTVSLTYDVESVEAADADIYIIDQKRGCFRREDNTTKPLVRTRQSACTDTTRRNRLDF